MSAWGAGGSARSCDALLKRVDENDPRLVDLVILPMKVFGGDEVNRLASSISSGRNTNLRSISASGHAVPPAALSALGAAIAAASDGGDGSGGIRSLAIGNRDMGDEGVAALCSSLKKSRGGKLQTIELGFKNISPTGMEIIGACFGKSHALRHLNFSRNEGIGSQGLALFCDAGEQLVLGDEANIESQPFPKLEYLDLSECNIGPQGVEALSSCLMENPDGNNECRSKLELMLASNPLEKNGCASLSKLIRSPVNGSSYLISLSLAGCSIGDDGIEALVLSSTGCGDGLRMLDLSRNGITSIGAQKLSEALSADAQKDGKQSFSDLGELRLAGNSLESDGVRYICMSLQQRAGMQDELKAGGNAALNVLDLSETHSGPDGAAAALRCGALSSLTLFNNDLGTDGFYAIATWLRGGHPSIETLDLGGNRAGEEAVAMLLREIMAPSTDETQSALRTLVLGGNSFGNIVAAALEELQIARPDLDVAHDRPTEDNSNPTPV
mmetsp:Transcript_40295/g.121363  ORF Transcript_40295/g.121363 Transcript_40295/m.121363 type:complete len:499 (-) Transcript_40295:18-1514(-)